MLSHQLDGFVLTSLGRVDEAVRALERAHRLDPRSPIPLEQIAIAYAGAGRMAGARAAYRRLLGLLPARPYVKVSVACTAAAVGEREDALRLLEEAVRARETELVYVSKDPRLALLRGDPRFAAIERRIAGGLFPANPADRS
jgi:Flp pilus assembly protein TadD